jgi:hypothetical protein
MESSMAKGISSSSSDDWRVESDLNTLLEAEKIEKDPKRMSKVRALAKQKMLDVAKVAAEGESGD